ncbi:molybdopterin-dependent oxidoreductase [Methanonatronarchaeum sp. AMET-Sl]|uniref:molybdopterin-dependent oxidoreductase n=1 Tax=Methanonatronarchaeum sp. AMET-Sl TaxID=3037654 RepID=UPI00244DC8D1|nr:molybdopterin-dependent oxidoreductase [Methanonatronarchaeum sp. AMET-Sl]WGI16825.1 molybdopterin-dependent oxidoreductase [Methanonatronarchaeum sp. AMET-Sl]
MDKSNDESLLNKAKLKRRTFLKATALTTAAGLAGYSQSRDYFDGMIGSVDAAPEGDEELVKTICTNCSLGCGLKARVVDGEFVGQEAWKGHPVNQGGMCSKGNAEHQLVKTPNRVEAPMVKEGGDWQRLDWDNALDDIADKLLDIREEYGPDSVMWMGSAKISNEEAYMFRKLAAFWGTNNVDHQARICHSTTVFGLANTWGYGAQTNNVNDLSNTKCAFFIGSNAAEAHPAAMRHVIQAREQNDAKIVVADPRYTKTAAQADLYVPFRSGTDIPLIMYAVKKAIDEGEYDEEMIENRTYGFPVLEESVQNYDRETVSNICGTPEEKLDEFAELLIENSGEDGPMTILYSMGTTQHSKGAQNVRSYAILQLVLGNAGKPGGGVNALRGHDNVQGATDMCILSHSLPAYYGLDQGGWEHWCNVWDVDYDWMADRFENKELMERDGFTVSRWYEGVIKDEDEIDQPNNVKAVVVWGHSLNSITEMEREKQALDEADLVVIVNPYPSAASALTDREDDLYLLPACTQLEEEGSVSSTSRQQQWRFKVTDPIEDSRPDYEIMLELADRFGFKDEYAKNRNGEWDEMPEDVTREINMGCKTIQYTGGTPETLKGHAEYSHHFNPDTLQAEGGEYDGDYFGKPWPCWNEDHPGTPILYRNDIPISEGGHDFRVRFGTESPSREELLEGLNDMMEEILEPVVDEISNVSMLSGENGHDQLVDEYGIEGSWSRDLETDYKQAIENNLVPSGRGKARIWLWEWANQGGDGLPVHREPINSPRPDLIEEYPTYADRENHYRLTTEFETKQQERKDDAEEYPLVLTSGRQVEHMGGGAGTRQCWWLVELQPEMYVEINPRNANDLNIRDEDIVWVETREGKILVKAKVTERPMEDHVFLPYHWFGLFGGEDRTDHYPEGKIPYGIGEPANKVCNYGYAWTSQMQETKAGICKIEKASSNEASKYHEIYEKRS